MKRRGICIGGSSKVRKWHVEEQDDAENSDADDSLGEELPSEDENKDDSEACQVQLESEGIVEEEPTARQTNPVAWMQLKVHDKLLPKIYFEIFQDLHADASATFCSLCSGDFDFNGQRLGYQGTQLHRIVKSVVAEGGDLEIGNGTVCRSLFEEPPSSRGPPLRHVRAGLLTAATSGPSAVGPIFGFTLGAGAQVLDRRNVVLGQVLNVTASGETMSENEELHPFRHLEAACSSSGSHDDILVASCGVCSEIERGVFKSWFAKDSNYELQQERYCRSKFFYPPLEEVVSEENAEEILDLVLREVVSYEAEAVALGGEAQTSIESGSASKVHHRCELLEVGLTKLLKLLDEVDFKTLGKKRAFGKRVQQRIRALGVKISGAKSWSEEGETEAYQQRAGL